MSTKPMLTLRDVCHRLTLGYSTVYELVKSGQLQAIKVGCWRVDPDDLEAFIASRKTAMQPANARAAAGVLDADDVLWTADNPFMRATH